MPGGTVIEQWVYLPCGRVLGQGGVRPQRRPTTAGGANRLPIDPNAPLPAWRRLRLSAGQQGGTLPPWSGSLFVRLDGLDTDPPLSPPADGLYYVGNRFHSPRLGRFLQRDVNP